MMHWEAMPQCDLLVLRWWFQSHGANGYIPQAPPFIARANQMLIVETSEPQGLAVRGHPVLDGKADRSRLYTMAFRRVST